MLMVIVSFILGYFIGGAIMFYSLVFEILNAPKIVRENFLNINPYVKLKIWDKLIQTVIKLKK